jgi:predicted dehydrogenase
MNVGIVGLGKIGLGYDIFNKKNCLTLTNAFFKSQIFNLKFGVDNKKNNLNILENNYLGIRGYNTINIFNEKKPEIVVVATPTETHYDIIKKILSFYSPKIILCEKPLSYSLLEAKKILAMCKVKKINLFINYQRISNPLFINLKKIISNDTNYAYGEIRFKKGIYVSASHFINLLLYFYKDVIKIYTKTKKKKIGKDYQFNFDLQFNNAYFKFIFSDYNSFKLISPNINISITDRHKSFIYKKKELYSPSKCNSFFKKKYQYFVINEIKNFLEKKKFNLCNGFEALKTEKVLNKLIN